LGGEKGQRKNERRIRGARAFLDVLSEEALKRCLGEGSRVDSARQKRVRRQMRRKGGISEGSCGGTVSREEQACHSQKREEFQGDSISKEGRSNHIQQIKGEGGVKPRGGAHAESWVERFPNKSQPPHGNTGYSLEERQKRERTRKTAQGSIETEQGMKLRL